MRIGVDATPLMIDQLTGVERYIFELITRMPQIGQDHDFLLYFNFFRKRWKAAVKRFAHDGVQNRVCRIPPPIMNVLHSQFGLPIDWVTGPLDVMFYPSSMVLPQQRGKIVVTVHDLIPLTHPEFCDPKYVRYIQKRVPPSIQRADVLIAVSDYTKGVVNECFKLKSIKVHVIPPGVHERFLNSKESEATDSILTSYGVRKPFLLFVGSLEPRKNLKRLVEAFRRANQSSGVREHTLVLVGKPSWNFDEIQSTIAKLDSTVNVLLPGYISLHDLPVLYRAATAFLFPSLVEGFGVPVLEAMACGCPVLTSARPPLSELAGDAALTIDPWDVDAIAEGIRTLVEKSEMRERLRTKGQTRAKEFSWDRTAAETLRVLETV